MSDAAGKELLARCEQLVDATLRGAIGMNGFDELLVALASLEGRGFDIARDALRRWLEQGGAISHFASKSKSVYHATTAALRGLIQCAPLMLAFAKEPALVVAILRTQDFFPDDARVAELIATFDDGTLGTLLESAPIPDQVGEALLRRGRVEAAQRCFDAISARWGAPTGIHAVRRRLLFGDREGAKVSLAQLDDASVQVAILRVDLGLETPAAARAELSKPKTKPAMPMAIASELLTFAQWLFERNASDPEVDRTLDAAQAQTLLPCVTQFDTMNEGWRKSEVACFREKVLLARGDREGAERAFLTHLADLGAIHGAVRVPGDRRQEAAMKNDVTLALVTGAARAGFVDVANKGIAKIAKAERARSASRIAEAFLPNSPDAALDALDTLAEDPDATLCAPLPTSLFPAMWAAVLKRS